jgi:lipid-A-disaccharide synthase
MSESCLIVAGEKSGEEHCLSFLDGLRQKTPATKYFGVGGAEMAQAGVELIFHLQEFSGWGYSGVVGRIPFYLAAMKRLEKEVVLRNCRVAILIDFQTFNLKLARRLHQRGVKILYYVAPQAWAWKSYRVPILAQTVHTLFTIIPFEKEWFHSRGVKRVKSIDHPVWTRYRNDPQYLTSIKRERLFYAESTKINLLLLPGSRNFEVKELLPEFIAAVKELKKSYNIVISMVKSPNVSAHLYYAAEEMADHLFESDQLGEALKISDLALAASGTVTLTTALFQVPTVVCYQTSLINQWIYETFVDYSGYISLANIVLEQQLFPELVGEQATSYNMVTSLCRWLENKEEWNRVREKLQKIPDVICGELAQVEGHLASEIKES